MQCQALPPDADLARQRRVVEAFFAATRAPFARPALITGSAGVTVVVDGKPMSIMAFTVVAGKVAATDVIAGPERLRGFGLAGAEARARAPVLAPE
ncbi:hypothetical protein [Streptomyces sp. NPDC091268]|uniref:hypothetical protein n=1 Tax=Streptomyces sp. NPDC091268 TaxID=3365979 RepID=UPI0037F76644